ncbi:hypothetical protein J27TS8_16310 [Robertmurraya siralis]|uniref:Uncharacterized protein n=1 Tax=Robertmurraya siralis TaxID=77777 RepID=A0A920BT52_9BACI|nr:hypothetical protein J27TS8_16310 [Robertmurraya siralis]
MKKGVINATTTRQPSVNIAFVKNVNYTICIQSKPISLKFLLKTPSSFKSGPDVNGARLFSLVFIVLTGSASRETDAPNLSAEPASYC